ncbi:MAG: hypothetical protein ABEJ28_00145 [Salinigranum sp.]
MAARPPQQGSEVNGTIEFGIAALAAHLDESDVEFPATAEEVVRAVDNTDVPYDASGRTVKLETALERVPAEEFDSQSDLLDQLHPVFEEYRASASRSLLGRLRSLVPL